MIITESWTTDRPIAMDAFVMLSVLHSNPDPIAEIERTVHAKTMPDKYRSSRFCPKTMVAIRMIKESIASVGPNVALCI